MREFDDELSTTALISIVYPLGPAAIILMPMIVGGVVGEFGFSEQRAGTIALATAYQMGVIAKLDTQGRYLVMITAFQGLGAAVGPSVAAALINGNDYSGINLAAATGNVVSIGLFLFIIIRSRQLTE